MKQKEVRAVQGSWRRRSHNGQTVSITGSFSPACRGDAFATASYLIHSHIVPRDFRPEQYPDGYVIRLGPGHDLAKFEHWAVRRNLLPKKREHLEREREEFLAHWHEAETMTPSFTPLAANDARELVNAMRWEHAEAPGHPGYIVADATPQAAFQAAYYLHKKGLLPKGDYQRLNREAASLTEGETLRIAVHAGHLPQFGREFPQAGQFEKPAPGWAREHESPERGGSRRQ